MEELLKKGTYVPINHNFMTEGTEVLQQLSDVQAKFDKNDTDTFINELRDSIVGYKLGYELVNIEKHGFDCKKSNAMDVYLEAKQASFHSKSWQATFNDTTYEKAEAFKSTKLFLALAVWKNAADLLFICYGQNSRIGDYLTDKIDWFKLGNTVRSTQSISLSTLVFEYGFKIISVAKTKDQLLELLRNKNRSFLNLNRSNVLTWEEFRDNGFEIY
jgi:hypothetical protein